ncbi:F0F1 ATP synthase subunit epsilon [Lipingzhangella sp. LS1_29]|uniref:ATP synthase epsilon chain n=1 Tax=Lipingzhangella rawalii TaxID=2055835 RepID=A0ABU2H586_9ACTN|nr:F0F1 ATP synthase subunit epsilon [Lipingzhangella rawalii]MDS1270472.1 F0F1 ATP synthase subunit epsilon [Lipingzhangella rawalii]
MATEEPSTLQVEIVSPERELWAGSGEMVIARTVDGEIGIQPGHIPTLAVLAPSGVVRVLMGRESGEVTVFVHSGFLSVSEDNRVSVMAEVAEMGEEIDTERARRALEESSSAGLSDPEELARADRARGRLRAAGELV